MERLTVYEMISDFDNAELPDYERDEQMKEAVREYNAVFGTAHDPERCLREYKRRLWKQRNEEPND